MGSKIVVFIACLMMANATLAEDKIPKDAKVFIDNADACEHFAGEFDGGLSKQRKKEIERGVVRHCGSAQKQLKRLNDKYKSDPKISEIIRSHTNDSVISFR